MAENTINILLLGETGVGKSTFINALANYLTYETPDEARNHEILYFIPTKFLMVDDDFQEKTIAVGSSANEVETPGASATQNPTSYLFDLGKVTLRIIDTPGMGDTRGMKYDEVNADKLLYYVSQLKHLNAVCILLKPNNSRLNVLFEYCIKQILARLDKKVCDNMVFLFTNARSSFYTPGDTTGPLKQILKDIESKPPYVRIPFAAENTFCLDNESFRYLVASSQGIKFAKNEVKSFEESWQKSRATCKRMIQYVLDLPQLALQGTVTINEARRLITILAQPVAEMLVLYEKAIGRLQLQDRILKSSEKSVAELKDNLYIPVTTYKVAQRVTTTTHSRSNGWQAGIGLSPTPPFVSFNVGYGENESTDTTVQEVIVPYETNVEDVNVKSQIVNKQEAAQAALAKIDEINTLINEYGAEAEVVLNAAVKFTIFLKENAIVAYSDVFQAYFEYLLQRERAKGHAVDAKMLRSLEDLLGRYNVRKNATSDVSAKEVMDITEDLLALKHSGRQIKHFHDKLYVFDDDQVYNVGNRANQN